MGKVNSKLNNCQGRGSQGCSIFCSLAAVEIRGHEETIIVGLMIKIYCFTHLNATRMEFFHVGVNLPQAKSHGKQNLTLMVNANSTVLNGARFMCRVTDVEWKQYEESVSIRVKGDSVYLIVMCKRYGDSKWVNGLVPRC